jgi:uncharacterized phage-associated protein
MFDERKVAQMAAFLLWRSGGTMPHLKLMKLLYLADRESLDAYGFPISWDRTVAMPHGPVLSQTLSILNGYLPSAPGGWDSWISEKANHQVSLLGSCDNLQETAFCFLTRADRKILNEMLARYGHMNKFQIRDFTHDHCSEWTDPSGSSFPISYESIFMALGKTPEEIEYYLGVINDIRSVRGGSIAS